MSYVLDTRCAPGASDEYVKARQELFGQEAALRDQIEKVAEQRRALPLGPIMMEYKFKEGPKDIKDTSKDAQKQVSLADLVNDGRTIVVYHLMFAPQDDDPCGMCGMMVDGLDSNAKHFDQHFNFVVIAKAPLDKIRAYAARRNWNHVRLLSSHGSDFNVDMKVEASNPEEGSSGQQPALSVFKKDDEGNVRHVWTQGPSFGQDVMRGLDLYTPFWNVLDVIPEGRGNIFARNDYVFD